MRPGCFNEWILRRVLLDSSLNAAIDYLKAGFTGDEVGLEILKANWQKRENWSQASNLLWASTLAHAILCEKRWPMQ